MTTPPPDATTQDGTYPRPQLMRSAWRDLSGTWDFAYDDALAAGPDSVVFDRRIEVPFPPESPASGIADTGFHPCVWYRRTITVDDLEAAGGDDAHGRVLLHFGAVDHAASVWVNGHLVAVHEGGQSPFTADISGAIDPAGTNELVVRAVDLPDDVSVLRGKQDWRETPHSIWYHRTTGIWQPVWLERLGRTAIGHLRWQSDLATSTVELDVDLSGAEPGAWVHVRLTAEGHTLAETRVAALGHRTVHVRLVLPDQLNGQRYEELLWSPERPTLVAAEVAVTRADGSDLDRVSSYVGLRSVAADAESFLLNDRPIAVRAVLAQNYWPETHLAATAAMLRREVELIRELGFNTARVHQKAEDPRFLYWADRLGLMLWGETASAYAFDPRSVSNLLSEWTALVRRDSSHPSIVAWVPLNESWGVQHIAHDPRQRAFSRAIADVTRAVDGTRPVISNDGWEHTDSDIWTIHDYEGDPDVVAERYADPAAVARMLSGRGPAGRLMSVGSPLRERPVMLTEFGGVSLATGSQDDWGYSTASDPEQFGERVVALLAVARSARGLSGYCYTQLTDTGQETNGLLYADRTPKVPIARIRAAVRGDAL